MIRIKTYKLRGSRSIALPLVWLQDQGLKPGDTVDVFQDSNHQLVIKPTAARGDLSGLGALAARESGGAA